MTSNSHQVVKRSTNDIKLPSGRQKVHQRHQTPVMSSIGPPTTSNSRQVVKRSTNDIKLPSCCQKVHQRHQTPVRSSKGQPTISNSIRQVVKRSTNDINHEEVHQSDNLLPSRDAPVPVCHQRQCSNNVFSSLWTFVVVLASCLESAAKLSTRPLSA